MGVPLNRSEFAVGDDPQVDVAVTRNCLPYDLTGKVVELAVRNPDGTTTLLSSAGPGPAISVTNAPGGVAVADMAGTMEVDGRYLYRARVVDPADGNRQLTFDRGFFTVS